jgi:hypothetical protein
MQLSTILKDKTKSMIIISKSCTEALLRIPPNCEYSLITIWRIAQGWRSFIGPFLLKGSCELFLSLCVRRRRCITCYINNQLIWNYKNILNQSLLEWFLSGPPYRIVSDMTANLQI